MKLTLTIPGKPQSKQRARKGKGGRWFTPKRTRDYERSVRMLASFSTPGAWVKSGAFVVELDLYMPDNRRRDVDNCAKSILDGCNGILWDDDSQIVRLTITKAIDKHNPRAVLAVSPAPDVLDVPSVRGGRNRA